MCSGKTTLGQALALASGRSFIDLDDFIARREGMSVSQIFATKGEAAFRDAEARALREAATTAGAVVACGGGTPCRPGAMELMNSQGLTVWLVPSRDRLMLRLMEGREARPLIAAMKSEAELVAFVESKMAERETYYRRSAATFDSSLLDTEEEINASLLAFRCRFGI